MKQRVFITIAILVGLALSAGATNQSTVFNELAKRMVETFKKLFGVDSQQVSSIAEIIRAWNEYGDGDLNKLAYIMATAWHESRLRPIKEIKAASNTDLWIRLQSRYWPSGFYGRGFIQITWEDNYRKMGKWLGVDLVGNPDLALDPEIAAKILVYGMMNGSFTGKRLSDYINDNKVDYFNARRIVNGTDKASLISGYASDIQSQIV